MTIYGHLLGDFPHGLSSSSAAPPSKAGLWC